MTDSTIGTPAQLRDPNYTPPLGKAIPLGIQHVLAMFVSNITPAIIVAGAAGIGFGSDQGALGFPDMTYMIQMSMLFAGLATLIQTMGWFGVGAKLPIVQGTSFAFLPVMIPAVAGLGTAGLPGLMTGVVFGGIFHFILGFFIGRFRFALPPLVTGLIVLMIGLALLKVGIQYAAGGVPNMGKPIFGSLAMWIPAIVVILVTLGLKFYTKGMTSVAAVLLGIIAGYLVALAMGQVNFGNIGRAAWLDAPSPFKWGFAINGWIIFGMCLMAIVSAIETVGDVSGITKGGAGREATDKEIQGATFADGVGTAIAGIFGGLPNTSFSQNVGLISMTGVMSRHVVTIGAIFLIICGFIPKIGAIINTIPINVLGGGVIIMFGMVASAGVNMLSDVNWTRRNMVIFATALAVGLGLQLVPEGVQHLSGNVKILMTSGLLPAAFIAIVLNWIIPDDEQLDGEHETQLSGLGSASVQGGSASDLLSNTASVATAGVATAAAGVAATAATTAKSTTRTVKKTARKASTTTRAKSTRTATRSKTVKAPAKKPAVKKAAAPKKAPAKKAGPVRMKKAQGKADDLKLISGVGPKLEKTLNGLGFWHFHQVAKWTKADVAVVDSELTFKGRIERDNWISQAKKLAKK